MNRLFLVRHGGSTGNANELFYAYHDSAVCLTTDGVRQALSTAEVLRKVGGDTWLKPGNFNLEVYASEYSRTQQTARICLDQIGILSVEPKVRASLNERSYGIPFNPAGRTDPLSALNGTEPAARARVRVRAFLDEIEPLLERSDVLAFTHEGALQALLANLRGTPTPQMMITIPNGAIYLFNRSIGVDGLIEWTENTQLPDPLLPIGAPSIDPPPAEPPQKGR
jgi:broad specificity phosphatase PhoE